METSWLLFFPLFTVPCRQSDVFLYERFMRTDGSTPSPPVQGSSIPRYSVIKTLISRDCRVISIRQDEGKMGR